MKMHVRDRSKVASWFLVLPAVGFAAVCATASAEYPERPVRIIVPFVAGGVPDFITRVISPGLTKRIGQQIVVDNRPGAGGKLGTEVAAATAGDGYTLVIGGSSSFGVTPALQGKRLRYDPTRSFAHIARVGESRAILVTHPSLPVRTVKELVALAKKRPNDLNYGSSGNGTMPHLFGEMFKYYAGGLKIRHIPYRGGPQALTAIVSGEVEILMGQIAPVSPFLSAGRVRALAVSGTKRSAALPEVPTFAEAGVKGLEATTWYVFSAPAGTPASIIARLNGEINGVMQDPGVQRRLAAKGVETTPPATPAEVDKFVKDEMSRWAAAVRLSGARVD
jgi:tripartite-type tricarboxylate transporter receptor subunit TctC